MPIIVSQAIIEQRRQLTLALRHRINELRTDYVAAKTDTGRAVLKEELHKAKKNLKHHSDYCKWKFGEGTYDYIMALGGIE